MMSLNAFWISSRPSKLNIQLDSPQLSCHLQRLLQLRFYAKTTPAQLQSKSTQRSGHYRLRRRGQGMEFHQARPYVSGDDARSIDWRISARKGKTHTREFHQDHERPQMLLVDISQNMCFASAGKLKSVQAAEYAAWIGWRYLNEGNRISGVIHTAAKPLALKPTTNPKRYGYWLNQLAQASQRLLISQLVSAHLSGWKPAIQTALRLISSGSQLHLIGDLIHIDEPSWQLLKHVARRYDIQAVHIQDPLETNLPISGHLSISDGQTSLSLNQANYRQAIDQQHQELHHKLYSIGANLITLNTTDELFDLYPSKPRR